MIEAGSRKGKVEGQTDFARNLRRMRESRNMSRHALSECCGLGHTMIGRYERGETEPTLAALAKMAKYLGVSITDLTGM